MNEPFLPFALPEIDDAGIAEVVDTLRSGWITTGPKARRFEQAFGDFLGDSGLHCIAVNSATAGLHLALEAIGIGPGDEVITTTHTFTATAEVVRYLGADVRLVDIDPATLNLDLDQVEAAIGPKTRAILPVHYAGLAVDMIRLLDIARRHGLRVVEDAAHALPATLERELIGTLGSDATVFSFYANKTMTTGEGGMLVTRNAQLAERAKVMRLHGINRDAFDRFTAKTPSLVLRGRGAWLQVQPDRHRCRAGSAPAQASARFPGAARADRPGLLRRVADLPLTLPPRAPAG
jgi:dTDP-4-amino-4,6-dideoxygalactose transaminase